MPVPAAVPLVASAALAALLGGLAVYLWAQRRLSALDGARSTATVLAEAAEQRLRETAEQLAQTQTRLTEALGEARHLSATLAARQAEAERAEAARSLAQEQAQVQHERAVLAERSLEVARGEIQRRIEEMAEMRRWVEDNNRLMEERMRNTANRLLEDKAQRFTEVNKREIDAIVGPFKEQLSEFRQRVDLIYQHDTQDRAQLKEQIVGLTALNQTVSKQARDLTQALTISTKATGNWGETILRKILEDSGLREGHEYRLQVSVKSEDERDQRPDAVIFLPENRQLVVDAKVSNKAWKDYCAEQDEALRARYFEDHLRSLRAHVRGLSERGYTQAQGLSTVDFVLMFVPVESALLEAIAADPQIYEDAYKRKVILVVPTTLLAVVKLAEGLWTAQRREINAERIADAGRKLYEKLVLFAESFETVGKAISGVQTSYEKARNQLKDGKGNAIGLAEKMRRLGVSPGKGRLMPGALLPAQGNEEEDEAATEEARDEPDDTAA